MLILREPDPNASGGGSTAQAPDPALVATPTPTPPPTQAASAAATKIEVTPEEYKRFLDNQTRLGEIEAQHRADSEAKEAARLKALADKGQAEEAMAQLRTSKDAEIQRERERANGYEREILSGHKSSVIADALLGADFVSDEAARDARLILDGRFESVRDANGTVTCREKGTGRPASEVIQEWRGTKASAHYLKPTTTGGAGTTGTNHAAASSANETLEARQARQIKEAMVAQRGGSIGILAHTNSRN
jgi:hypothetical protein